MGNDETKNYFPASPTSSSLSSNLFNDILFKEYQKNIINPSLQRNLTSKILEMEEDGIFDKDDDKEKNSQDNEDNKNEIIPSQYNISESLRPNFFESHDIKAFNYNDNKLNSYGFINSFRFISPFENDDHRPFMPFGVKPGKKVRDSPNYGEVFSIPSNGGIIPNVANLKPISFI